MLPFIVSSVVPHALLLLRVASASIVWPYEKRVGSCCGSNASILVSGSRGSTHEQLKRAPKAAQSLWWLQQMSVTGLSAQLYGAITQCSPLMLCPDLPLSNHLSN